MTEQSANEVDGAAPTRRKSRWLPLMALLLFALSSGGGFVAIRLGLVAIPGADRSRSETPLPQPDIAYVPLDPMVINMGDGPGRFLRFQAQIEVHGRYRAEVTALQPRIVDVLNSYLRAVDANVLEDRGALVRLKSQMLRRVQLVAGGGRVRDLLVMEFVVN